MYTMSSGGLDFLANFASNLQLSSFTQFSGSLARSLSVSLASAASPGSDPKKFTKVFAAKVSGDPTTVVDLTNVTLVTGQTGQTITPKAILVYAEWPANGSGVISLAKDGTNGYTGAYGLDTNTYRANEIIPAIILLGFAGTAPTSEAKRLRLAKVSGDNPTNTYLIIWGD